MAESDDETSLAKSTPSALDRYEQEFMVGQGMVLYRAKARAHPSLAAMVLGLGGIAAAGVWASTGPIAAVLLFFAMAFMWILFAVLRVTVSEEAVNIQLGVFGPRIPIAAIVEAEATTYGFTDFGGWGIRYGRKGVMYNMPGDGGQALRIKWRDDRGKTRTTWVGTREAPQLVTAIERARAAALSERAPKALREDEPPSADD